MQKTAMFFDDDTEARDNDLDSKILGGLSLDGGGVDQMLNFQLGPSIPKKSSTQVSSKAKEVAPQNLFFALNDSG
jgi:hypothetical protein